MINFFALITTITMLTLSCSSTNKESEQSGMTEHSFWEIIEPTGHITVDEQLEEIEAHLTKYDNEGIVEFERILCQKINNALDYNLIAAHKIMTQHLSDDTFLYFRCWLILQGENMYYNAIKTPDTLARHFNRGVDTWGEGLLYVSTNAYLLKNNKTIGQENHSFPRNVCINEGINYDAYTDIKGDSSVLESLERSLPELWQKFRVR